MTKVKFDDHVIAHKFTSIPGCPWQDFMEKYDGERGLVVEVEEHYVGVEFADTDMYFFPHSAVDLVEHDEAPLERGDTVEFLQRHCSDYEQVVGKLGVITSISYGVNAFVITAEGLTCCWPLQFLARRHPKPAVIKIGQVIKAGDPVRVCKFTNTWTASMDDIVDKIGHVTQTRRICGGYYFDVMFEGGREYCCPAYAVNLVNPDTANAPKDRRRFKLGEKVIARKFESTRSIVWGDSLEQFVGKPATIGKEIDHDGDYKLIFAGGLYRYFPASAVSPFEEASAPDGSHVTMKSEEATKEINVGAMVEVQKYDECLWMDHSLVGATGVVLGWRGTAIAPHYQVKIADTMKAFPREALKLVEPLKDDQRNAGKIGNLDVEETVVTRRGFPLGGVPEPFVSPTRVERVLDLDDTITRGDRMGIDQPACTYRGYEPPDENPHALAEWLRKPLTHGKGSR